MAQKGPQAVDGRGVDRVVARFVEDNVWLRPAHEEDCRLVWDWANEPSVRAASFTTDFIPWEKHQEWFRTKLQDPNCAFFLALDGTGTPVGQVRFDRNQDDVVISVSLAPECRGRGIGKTVIQKGARKVFSSWGSKRIQALIKVENESSHRAFLSAGFSPLDKVVVKGQLGNRLVVHPSSLDG
jgi:RimJ/RimL family protein N-acetyltransferase